MMKDTSSIIEATTITLEIHPLLWVGLIVVFLWVWLVKDGN